MRRAPKLHSRRLQFVAVSHTQCQQPFWCSPRNNRAPPVKCAMCVRGQLNRGFASTRVSRTFFIEAFARDTPHPESNVLPPRNTLPALLPLLLSHGLGGQRFSFFFCCMPPRCTEGAPPGKPSSQANLSWNFAQTESTPVEAPSPSALSAQTQACRLRKPPSLSIMPHQMLPSQRASWACLALILALVFKTRLQPILDSHTPSLP